MSVAIPNNPWIRVNSGGRFHLLNPLASEIKIDDIAWSLARSNRFVGHTRGEPYSTAEHCVRASYLVAPELALVTLLHDAAEYAISDLNGRLKPLLPDYKRIEHRIERAIAAKYGLSFPFPPEVKRADLVMLATEQRDLRYKGDWQDLPYHPLTIRIKPWPWKKAYREFLKRFHQLYRPTRHRSKS